MLDCKAMNTPMDTNMKLLSNESLELVDVTQYIHIIGSLMYLTNTRPYIWFVVNSLIQYLVKPRRVLLIAPKHVMRYLKCMIDFLLYYGRDHDYKLYGYTISYWEGSVADRKSTLVVFPRWVSMLSLVFEWVIDAMNVYVNGF